MNGVLTAAELASMQEAIGDLLPDTCDLLTSSYAADGQGGGTTTWGTVTASVACRLDYVRGNERTAAGALQPFTGYVLTLPHDTTVTSAYRVVHNSITYTIQSVSSGTSWKSCVRAWLEKL
jgi:SPP1 family predicted phage head-tail adaptor